MLIYFIIENILKVTIIKITINLIQKVFKYWETVTVMAANKVLQNSNFLLKAQIVSLATNMVSCFYCSDKCTSFVFPRK